MPVLMKHLCNGIDQTVNAMHRLFYLSNADLPMLKMLACFLFAFLCVTKLYSQETETESNEDKMVTRGRGYLTLSFSLDQRNAENEDQLFQQVIDQDKVNYRVSLNGGYAIMDNFTLGLGVSYGREREDITFLNQDNVEVTSRALQNDISFIPNMPTSETVRFGAIQKTGQHILSLCFHPARAVISSSVPLAVSSG
jgi:hypothetical protein